MKVGNTITLIIHFCVVTCMVICAASSASPPLEEVEARVYCTHVPPSLQIIVPSLVDKLYGPDQCRAVCYNSVWLNGSYTCM